MKCFSRKLWRNFFFAALSLAPMGCVKDIIKEDRQPQEGSSRQGQEHVAYKVVEDAPYYADGPQQARPPDGTIAKGTQVKILMDSGSYVLIETTEGLRVYVPRSALKKVQNSD